MLMTIEEFAMKRTPKPLPDVPDNVIEQFRIEDRVVCTARAADGIGFAVVEGMAEAGPNLALWYNINNAAIAKGAELEKRHNVKVIAYHVEVSDPNKVWNFVSPGWFQTKMGASPADESDAHRMAVLGRQGHAKEIKGLHLYLASDRSTFAAGSDILIGGGYTLP